MSNIKGDFRDPSGIRTRGGHSRNAANSPGFSPDLNARAAGNTIPVPIRCEVARQHKGRTLRCVWDAGHPGEHTLVGGVR